MIVAVATLVALAGCKKENEPEQKANYKVCWNFSKNNDAPDASTGATIMIEKMQEVAAAKYTMDGAETILLNQSTESEAKTAQQYLTTEGTRVILAEDGFSAGTASDYAVCMNMWMLKNDQLSGDTARTYFKYTKP